MNMRTRILSAIEILAQLEDQEHLSAWELRVYELEGTDIDFIRTKCLHGTANPLAFARALLDEMTLVDLHSEEAGGAVAVSLGFLDEGRGHLELRRL